MRTSSLAFSWSSWLCSSRLSRPNWPPISRGLFFSISSSWLARSCISLFSIYSSPFSFYSVFIASWSAFLARKRYPVVDRLPPSLGFNLARLISVISGVGLAALFFAFFFPEMVGRAASVCSRLGCSGGVEKRSWRSSVSSFRT